MRQVLIRLGGIFALTALMSAGAQIDVPMHPVPMTLQSLFVLLAGLCLGPKDGLLAVLLYLLAALFGLPVLAEGSSGPAPFNGPTAGYIYAFPVAAFIVGLLRNAIRTRAALVWVPVLFALHFILLGAGTLWLSATLGLGDAAKHGFTPFLIGAGVKSVLAWALWRGVDQIRRGGTG